MRSRLTEMSDSRAYLWLILLVGVLTAYRALVPATTGLLLNVDEAYYWGWAQNLDWGYFSKPPMIAALIALTTGLCGDGVSCVKLGSLLVYPITTLLIFRTGQVLYDARTGLVAAALFLLMPGVSLSSLIISTDVLLFMFWALGLLALARALETNAWRHWLLLGLACGLGLMSKYTMVLFAPSILFAFLIVPEWRHHLLNSRLWVAALLAALIFLPNVLWNAMHGWPTLHHTVYISHLDKQTLRWDELGTFLGGQFVVFGPLALLLWLVALRGAVGQRSASFRANRLLAVFSLTFLGVITMQALLGRAHANWAAPSFVAASILLAHWCVSRPRWLLAALLINVMFMFGIYHYERGAHLFGVELSGTTDPFKRVRGWEQLSGQFAEHQKEFQGARLMSEDREVLALLTYHRRLPSDGLRSWNPEGQIRHQYDLFYSLSEKDIGTDLLYVTGNNSVNEVASHFSESRRLEPLEFAVHPDWIRHYEVYLLRGYKG